MLKRLVNSQAESNLSRIRKNEEIRRQMARHRRNLISICRLTVQSLLEKAMYDSIDDTSEEFLNFATIFEHILSHRLKGESTWFGLEESREFWDFIFVACHNVPNNCLQSIHLMEDARSSRAKGRAWIRAVLMEKRLCEYFTESLEDKQLLKMFYGEGSFMNSEESVVLKESLQQLNLVDFSFCLKGGDNLESGVARVIDYTPYLSCSERLSGNKQQGAMEVDNSLSPVQEDEQLETEQSVYEQLENLKLKYYAVCEQKRYLEERLQMGNEQVNNAIIQMNITQKVVERLEERSQVERRQLENVIMELQDHIGYLKDAHLASRKELEDHLTSGHWHHRDQIGVAGSTIAMDHLIMPSNNTATDRESFQSLEDGTQSSLSSNSLSLTESRQVTTMREARKEATPSLIPLAGSFTSQLSLKSGDIVFTSSTSSANFPESSQTLPKLSETGSVCSGVSLADSLQSTVSAPP